MPTAKLNDITMYYEVQGEGTPLIFIGGFSADHLVWAEQALAFMSDFQVITLDNRGAGQTTIPDGAYTVEQMADDVVSLCQHLDIEQAYFVGHSMGGCIL